MKRIELSTDPQLGNKVTRAQWRVVTNAIKQGFKGWREILPRLRYHHGDNFYSFTIHGMFVGVELDGYIHT